jgi:predicted phage-related endonuclease
MRTVHTLQQGGAAWLAHRAAIFNASEAPAVMGSSKYLSRSELLRQKSTGLAPEVSPQTQALFDRGHAVEAPTIALIEEAIGEALAPVVASIVIDGLTLGASYDGLSFMEDIGAEVKLWNEDLARQIRSGILDMHYVWQLEQQFIVTPSLERIIFATSDGTRDKFVYMDYRPVKGRRSQLLAGWGQFAKDLAAYVPPAAGTVEKIVAEPVQALPAPSVQVSGELVLRDNFKAFETALRDFLEHRLIREPKTDQDFADLDVQIKAMKGAEAALESAEAQMLAQIQTVDQAKKTKDMLARLVRDNRLMAEKLLASEKERRRGEIVAGGLKAIQEHVEALNTRLGKRYMPTVVADFAGCIKGLKSLASMEDKVASHLATLKIEANATADRIDANLKHLREHAEDYRALFPDTATLVLRTPEDCQLIVQARITEHKAAEERRLEAERVRIRAEEEARAQRLAQEREAAERRQREEADVHARARAEKEALDAEERREQAALAESLRRELAPAAGPAYSHTAPMTPAQAVSHAMLAVPNPPPPAVIPMPARTPAAPTTTPTLRLGQINERLGFTVSADFLASIGYPMAGTDKAAKLWHEASFHSICAAIAQHVVSVANGQRQAA